MCCWEFLWISMMLGEFHNTILNIQYLLKRLIFYIFCSWKFIIPKSIKMMHCFHAWVFLGNLWVFRKHACGACGFSQLWHMWVSPKWVKSKKRRKRKKKRKDWTMVKTMAKLRMAHASTHGARKPPGPKLMFITTVLDLLITFPWSNKDSIHLSRRNKPVHFGGSSDFLYCTKYLKFLGIIFVCPDSAHSIFNPSIKLCLKFLLNL